MITRIEIATQITAGMLAHDSRYRPRDKDKHLHWHDAIAKEAFEIAEALMKADMSRKPRR